MTYRLDEEILKVLNEDVDYSKFSEEDQKILKDFIDKYKMVDITGPRQKAQGAVQVKIPLWSIQKMRVEDYRFIILPAGDGLYKARYYKLDQTQNATFIDNYNPEPLKDIIAGIEKVIEKRTKIQNKNSDSDSYEDGDPYTKWGRETRALNAVEEGIELACKEVGDIIKHSYAGKSRTFPEKEGIYLNIYYEVEKGYYDSEYDFFPINRFSSKNKSSKQIAEDTKDFILKQIKKVNRQRK